MYPEYCPRRHSGTSARIIYTQTTTKIIFTLGHRLSRLCIVLAFIPLLSFFVSRRLREKGLSLSVFASFSPSFPTMSQHDTKAVRRWVEDHLHSLLGFSERALADYCISLAKRSSDASTLASSLESQGLPSSSDTKRFAEDLLEKIPRQHGVGSKSGVSSYKEQELAAAAAARRNARYALLVDGTEDDGRRAVNELEKNASASKLEKHRRIKEDTSKKAKGSERRRLRRRRDDSEAEDVDEGADRGKSRKRSWEEKEELDGDQNDKHRAERRSKRGSRKSMTTEDERDLDLEEREEFERRLKEKDEAKTRRLLERKIPREELEEVARRRRAEEAADRAKVIEDLRKMSRQEYLKKREEMKLEDLEAELEDERSLFAGEKLTEEEIAELKYKEEVLRLAKERQRHRAEIEADDAYKMPTAYDESSATARDARYDVLKQRYQDVSETANTTETPWAQQEVYEKEQIKKALVSVGARDKKQADVASSHKEYDFVMDDQIDFVEAAALAGDLDAIVPETREERMAKERAAQESARQSAFEKIQSERRDLPMYQYREELLKAIEEHQVLIIVGETGSGELSIQVERDCRVLFSVSV